jgi:hypothetical protein
MPSPICEIQDGAGAFTATTNGKDVTPANTVTIRLASAAGVGVWDIICITTDETSDAEAVTLALVVNQTNKTATFTAPSSGKAYRFQSRVNNGIDSNGVVQASYTTTFCVYTLTAGSRRVHAVDETFESHATFGWVGDMNSVIRNPTAVSWPTGTGFLHLTAGSPDAAATANVRYASGKLQIDTNLQFKSGANLGDLAWAPSASRTLTLPDATDTLVGRTTTDTLTNKTLTSPTINTPIVNTPSWTTPKLSDSSGGQFYNFAVSNLAADRTVTWPLLTGNDTLVFEAHTQTLTNKTLTSPTISGPTVSGTVVYQGTRFSIRSIPGEVQTSSTSATTVASYTMTDETHCQFDAIVTFARRTNVTKAGTYKLSVAYRRTSAGAPTIVGALVTQTDQETTAGDTVTIDVSSNDVRVRVTAADTDGRNWSCELRVQETTNA